MRILACASICCALLVAACAQHDVEKARPRTSQEGASSSANPHTGTNPHTGMGLGMGGDSNAPTDGNAIPLKQSGVGGATELQREKAALPDAAGANDFERAFRLTFTTDRTQRDYSTARELLLALIQKQPRFAGAYRTLGYAEFSLNPGDVGLALQHYNKAVELHPNYGEAHYAIAFMHAATENRQEGLQHYRKAMELGVADERHIGERFYGDLLKTP